MPCYFGILSQFCVKFWFKVQFKSKDEASSKAAEWTIMVHIVPISQYAAVEQSLSNRSLEVGDIWYKD